MRTTLATERAHRKRGLHFPYITAVIEKKIGSSMCARTIVTRNLSRYDVYGIKYRIDNVADSLASDSSIPLFSVRSRPYHEVFVDYRRGGVRMLFMLFIKLQTRVVYSRYLYYVVEIIYANISELRDQNGVYYAL